MLNVYTTRVNNSGRLSYNRPFFGAGIMTDFHGVVLETDDNLFRPTTISEYCAENVNVRGKTVLDLGCGIGPLAIYFAKNGALKVTACDVLDKHVELTRTNAFKNKVKIDCFVSDLFSNVQDRYEVICCDVSGVDKRIAEVTGWFPEEVPTADESGSNLIIKVVKEAGTYLVPDGELYVCATSLSDIEGIEAQLTESFGSNWIRSFELDIPFSNRLIKNLELVEKRSYKEVSDQYFWQFVLYKATNCAGRASK